MKYLTRFTDNLFFLTFERVVLENFMSKILYRKLIFQYQTIYFKFKEIADNNSKSI